MRNFRDPEGYRRLRRENADLRRKQLEADILAWLRAQAIDQHAGAVGRAVGVCTSSAQRILRELVKRGDLWATRIGLGGRTFYRVPPPPDSFPVTDPDLDAPDGAKVDGYERVGRTWQRRA